MKNKKRGCAGCGDVSTAVENTSPRPHLDDLVYFLLGSLYLFAFFFPERKEAKS